MQIPDKWFRVEVTDGDGLVVAIETESLAGRDIGDAEAATIRCAIAHLTGFVGDDPPPWVPVGERLPEDGHHYLGYCLGPGSCTVFFEGGKWKDCFGYEDVEVTHWMPLPAAPNAASGREGEE